MASALTPRACPPLACVFLVLPVLPVSPCPPAVCAALHSPQVTSRGRFEAISDNKSYQFMSAAPDGMLMVWDVRFEEKAGGSNLARRNSFSEKQLAAQLATPLPTSTSTTTTAPSEVPPWTPIHKAALKAGGAGRCGVVRFALNNEVRPRLFRCILCCRLMSPWSRFNRCRCCRTPRIARRMRARSWLLTGRRTGKARATTRLFLAVRVVQRVLVAPQGSKRRRAGTTPQTLGVSACCGLRLTTPAQPKR